MGKQARLRQQRRAAAVERRAAVVDIIAAFQDAAPSVIYRFFKVNSCLNATRIAIEAFAAFGVKAEPLAVRCLVMNAKEWEFTQASGTPKTKEESDARAAQGAWSLGVGYRKNEAEAMIEPDVPADESWYGHLVCLVGDTLIDPSSRQMHRPKVGIIVDDCVSMDINRGFMENADYAIGINQHGTALVYQLSGADYRQPGFERSHHNLYAAGLVIQKMKQLLEERSRAKSARVDNRG